MSLRVLGVDPSLTCTGTALFADGKVVNAWAHTPQIRGVERLAFLTDQVLRNAQQADFVAIEDYGWAANTAGIALGELGGVLRYRLRAEGIQFETWHIQTWRKALTGKGTAAKDEVRLAVFKKLGFEHPNLNVLEAVGIGYAAWLYRQDPATLTEYQRCAFAARRKTAA